MSPRHQPLPEELTQRARQLRRNSTGPERALWRELRDRRLAGLKFRRQAPIGPFIVDFLCEARQLVVELDGQSHIGRADYDRARTNWLEANGCRILRIDNDDAIKDMESVLTAILRACDIEIS